MAKLEAAARVGDNSVNQRERVMAKGILIAAIDFSGMAEDEFHDWYDTEHLPERQRVPGFLT